MIDTRSYWRRFWLFVLLTLTSAPPVCFGAGDMVSIDLVSGALGATSDRNSLQSVIQKALGSPVQIVHPDDPASADGAFGDQLGYSIAMSGSTALVGAPFDDNAGGVDAGAVYVFVRSTAGWQLEAKLMASDRATQARFGASVALAGDMALVGAPNDPGGMLRKGAAYAFDRSGASWTQVQKLQPSFAQDNQRFGAALAIANGRAIITAPDFDSGPNLDSGVAYVFSRVGMIWTQSEVLTATSPEQFGRFGVSVGMAGEEAVIGGAESATAFSFINAGWSNQGALVAPDAEYGDRFGFSVAVTSSAIIVGAPYDSTDNFLESGSISIFKKTGATWAWQSTLVPPEVGNLDHFGYAVALENDRAIVSAWRAQHSRGFVYSLRRNANTWSSLGRIVASDSEINAGMGLAVALSGTIVLAGAPLAQSTLGPAGSVATFDWSGATPIHDSDFSTGEGASGDGFGGSLAISGDTAVVGAPFRDGPTSTWGGHYDVGEAFVFVRTSNGWALQARLKAVDPEYHSLFGAAVAIADDIVLVGSPEDGLDIPDSNEPDAGSVYVFVRENGAWLPRGKFRGVDTGSFDRFGSSISISERTAVIGAPGAAGLAGADAGAVYVFTRNGDEWIQQSRLEASVASASAAFGSVVVVSGDTIAGGAPKDDTPVEPRSGSVFVFERVGGQWLEKSKLFLADGRTYDLFGQSVALSGSTLIAGAPSHNGLDGTVAVFVRTNGSWIPHAEWNSDAVNAGFGATVALSGDFAVVGAPAIIGDGPGFTQSFVRSGATWMPASRFEFSTSRDYFGAALAISGPLTFVGAPYFSSTDSENPEVGTTVVLDRTMFSNGFE